MNNVLTGFVFKLNYTKLNTLLDLYLSGMSNTKLSLMNEILNFEELTIVH